MKKFAFAALFLLFAAQTVFGGRQVFSTVATVENAKHVDQFLRGESWDYFMLGADGKLFMLHFHSKNPLEFVRIGDKLKIDYVQEDDLCQTGFIDEIISLSKEK